MGEATTPIELVARKPHLCSICGETIRPGTTYRRWRWFDAGDATTIKVHPDCIAFFDEHDIHEWTQSNTFIEQLTGWMEPDEARAAIEVFEDEELRGRWLAYLAKYYAEDDDG